MARFFSLVAICLAFSAGLLSCAPDAERVAASKAPSGPMVDIVDGLMTAFNDHDPDKMRRFWHEDVTWFEVTASGASVITPDAQALYDELVVYFETYPSVRSTLEGVVVNGRFVAAVERSVWDEDGNRRSQASNVVYEIVDGRVKKFWYFPPQ